MKQLNRIQEVLKEKGKSQTWLASQLEVDPVSISRYVNGARQITLDDLYKIAKILKVSGRDLITF